MILTKSKYHHRSVNGMIVLSEPNFSFISRSHSSNDAFTSFDSPDDIDYGADNVIRTKIEMFSDEFSQSIDSSRFSKSTSSTAETDTMTTEDDIETSWCRISKESDCDVGCELDYLESKVKDLKTKQDRNVTHGIISATGSSSIPDKSETSIKDLKSGEGRIIRLKTLSTSKKITARLSYENNLNIPHVMKWMRWIWRPHLMFTQRKTFQQKIVKLHHPHRSRT